MKAFLWKLIGRLALWCAPVESIAPKLLREAYELHKDGRWEYRGELQDEAFRFLGFVAATAMRAVPNYLTTTLTMQVTDDTWQQYELTLRHMTGKTPQERIGELEAELAALRT